MAIGHRPDLLILDEPVASLDPIARRQFLRALVEFNADLNRTILFSTHITSDLERVAADAAVLHSGKIRYHGDLDSLKEGCQRLHLTGKCLPEDLAAHQIINYRQDGSHATAFVQDWNEKRLAKLKQSMAIDVVAASLPLDELFMELTHD